MRIEINLSLGVSNALKKKAAAMNHSRKSYIELLCIKDANHATPENVDKPECQHPYSMVVHWSTGPHCRACGCDLN
jgi:hypothetical protein